MAGNTASHYAKNIERRGMRHAQVRQMLAQGCEIRSIAQVLGVSERTVYRDLDDLGLAEPIVRGFTSEQKQLASRLIEDQCPISEIARTLDCCPVTLKKYFPDYHGTNEQIRGRHLDIAERLGLVSANFQRRA